MSRAWLLFVVLAGTLALLTGCDGGTSGDYPEINVRWRRETPPQRSEYSVVIFSRQTGGGWRDCLSVSGTHLEVAYEAGRPPAKPRFVLSTNTKVVVEVSPEIQTKQGVNARNLGLSVISRGDSEVQELPEGSESP